MMISCVQDEYTSGGPVDTAVEPNLHFGFSRPPQNVGHRPQRPLQDSVELSSSVPYGLNSQSPLHHTQQVAPRLLQHSQSVPSSPQKLASAPLHVQSPMYATTNCFGDVSYSVAERMTTNRSKVLPKEVVFLLFLFQFHCHFVLISFFSSYLFHFQFFYSKCQSFYGFYYVSCSAYVPIVMMLFKFFLFMMMMLIIAIII